VAAPEPEPAAHPSEVATPRETPLRRAEQPPPVAAAHEPRERAVPPREAARAPASKPREALAASEVESAQVSAPPQQAPPASLASEAAPLPPPEPALTVRVERTLWHPTPEKRSALVRVAADGEPRELSEGDAVDGFVVQEIRPSGVIFARDGREWRRGVGED
jgi:hypothetical protein